MTLDGPRKNIDRALIGEVLGEIVAAPRGGDTPAVSIGLMAVGSEQASDDDRGQGELLAGALAAVAEEPSIRVVMVGPRKIAGWNVPGISWIETGDDEAAVAEGVNRALASGAIAGTVALHYPFPLGTATVGRVVTPLRAKPMIVASTTGAAATDRVEAMVRNAIGGIATAKALGIAAPTVGVLNVDGAPTVKRILDRLRDGGYDIRFGESVRADGGALLRGNDLLAGAVDVCVADTLTGNILMKLFSSWTSGGSYEAVGYGYGPSVGEGWDKVVSIISRASGAPVIANAVRYTAAVLRGGLSDKVAREFAAAKSAGLASLLADAKPRAEASGEVISAPSAEPTDEEIHGVDVLSIEDATHALWAKGIYAEASMGCTGPVVKVPRHALERASALLAETGYL